MTGPRKALISRRTAALAFGLGSVFLVLVSLAFPLWTVGRLGYGDARAVRHSVLWDDVWSGDGGGRPAFTDRAFDGASVALLLGAAALAVGLLTRRSWSAPVALLGGAVVATWGLTAVGLAASLPTDPGPVLPGLGTATIGVAGVWALAAVLYLGSSLRRTGRSATAGMSSPPQPTPSWGPSGLAGAGAGYAPGYGYGSGPGPVPGYGPPAGQPWGTPPAPGRGAGTRTTTTPSVLGTGVAALVLFVVAALTGLTRVTAGRSFVQEVGVFSLSATIDGEPLDSQLLLGGLVPSSGWASGWPVLCWPGRPTGRRRAWRSR